VIVEQKLDAEARRRGGRRGEDREKTQRTKQSLNPLLAKRSSCEDMRETELSDCVLRVFLATEFTRYGRLRVKALQSAESF
jgi:hypothetical protein